MKRIVFIAYLSLLSAYGCFAQEKPFKKSLHINGRIQYDYEFLKSSQSDKWFVGNEFRRLRLSASGDISPRIKYKIEVGFPKGQVGFREVYIKYTAGEYGNFALGSMAEPTSLAMATSSKYIPFFERAMLTALQNSREGSGLHYENFKLFDNKAGFQMAWTNNGFDKSGFLDTNLADGSNFMARATFAPLNDKEQAKILHVGINFASRTYRDLKFKGENHLGEKYHYEFIGADRRTELGFELAGTLSAISLQGEYKTQSLHNDVNKTYQMSAYYAMASYFVTGEHRPYKKASFGRVKPNKPIDQGGLGALEVLLRFSNMSVSADVVNENAGLPDQVNNITFGLNWYLTSHARLMYNYIATDNKNSILGKLSGHLLRVQIDF